MCTNCHTIMKAVSRKIQMKTAFEPDTCFQCHKDRRAQMFRSSHMPMREGKMVCSDCHNPHGSVTEALLKKDSINDICYTCHAEKRGPFLFEHEPVRENCLNCHDPHGTVNEYSLKLSRPRLCFECHQMGHGSVRGSQTRHSRWAAHARIVTRRFMAATVRRAVRSSGEVRNGIEKVVGDGAMKR